MAALTAGLIGAGLLAGLEKNREEQKARSDALEQNKVNLKYSPWLGTKPGPVPGTNAAGDVAGGAIAGFQLANGIQGGGAKPGEFTSSTGEGVGGTGSTNFSLTGPATNSSPYSLMGPSAGAAPSPMSGMGSAGSLGSPWFAQKAQTDLDPNSVYGLK